MEEINKEVEEPTIFIAYFFSSSENFIPENFIPENSTENKPLTTAASVYQVLILLV